MAISYLRVMAEPGLRSLFRSTKRPVAALREITTCFAAEVTSRRFTDAARVMVRIDRSLAVMVEVYRVQEPFSFRVRRSCMTFKGLCAAMFLVCAPLALAQRRGGPGTGNPDEHLVPWRFLQGDVLLHERPVTLYWIPASLEESQRSRLMTSDVLRVAATRCVDLEIVLPEHAAKIPRLDGKAPAAVLVDRLGNVVQRHENVQAEAVERMLSDELAARDEAMYREMRNAVQQAGKGENAAAVESYKKIWDDRCLFPLAGSEAQRALKKLGVTVVEPAPSSAVDPQLAPPAKTPATQH
jgi:hypothetical protein